MKPATKCIHSGYAPKNGEPRQIPICQSTTYKYDSSVEMGKLFDLEASGYFYTRLQNPTNDCVAARIAEGFVNASILFCTGAMAIVGSIQDGILGDHTTLFAKGTLDGIISMILSANVGIGVLFSAVSVGIYQGSITALAGVVEPYVTPQILAEVTAAGGVMIMAIGTNMLNVTKIRIANLLPGMIPAAILAMYF